MLQALGASFLVRPAEVDETAFADEDPAGLALRLARSKAEAVYGARPGLPVLAADTVVALDGRILGKPADPAENAQFIRELSGREHQVVTGHVLLGPGGSREAAPVTVLSFRELEEQEILRYAASGEGLDKAGGYGLQGLGGALVQDICGCHTNVIGLSLPAVLHMFRELGAGLA